MENDKIILTKEELLTDVENNSISKDDIEGLDDSELTIEVDKRNLVIEKTDPDVMTLINRYQRNKLHLQPDYQRKYVMKAPVASRLIESMLLNIPLPTVYFAEEEDGSWSVIDGQQRLTAIISFYLGNFINDSRPFKLSGLNVMTELKGKTFKDLEDVMQEKILSTPIRVNIIKKESNDDIKFEIFERLNTGSTPLNEDEIRNTVYRGTYMNLLRELENDPKFDKIVNKPNFKNRMLYRGMILRFFALHERTHINYKPSMKQFCNKHLKDYRNMDEDKAKEYKILFKETMDKIDIVFGENAFRRLTKDENSNNYIWIKTRINMALYDVQMFGFTIYSKDAIVRHQDEIRDAMYELMTNDIDFINSIEIKTSNIDMVKKRFNIWLDALENIMKNETKNPRIFPYEVKKQLYDRDDTCKLCGQRIIDISNAHVDHIVPFSKGGLTNISNAQITHRYCNQHKSANTDTNN